MFLQMVKKYKLNTRRIFLLDGLGALLTMVVTGFVLPYFSDYFGIPEFVLFSLSALALTLAIYSSGCFLWGVKRIRPFLIMVVIGNSIYCLVSVIFFAFVLHGLTVLGWIYFFIELLIMLTLIAIEISIFIAIGKDAIYGVRESGRALDHRGKLQP